MAKPYITLKFEQTIQDDTVTFYADGNYRVFTCRNGDLQLFQYNDNADPASNNGAISFGTSIEQSLSSDYEYIRNGKVITIKSIQDGNDKFDFGVITIDNSNGSVVTALDQGNADGTTGLVLIDNRVTPLQINSITHNVSDFYSPAIDKDFVYGNSGDIVTTTINFNTFKDGQVGRFDFRYGLLSNDITAISTDTQTNTPYIPDAYFRNFETNNVQSFSIDKTTGDVSLNNPKNWQKDNITLVDNGGGDYDIIHIHYLAGFARTEDVAGNSLTYPDEFKGNASPKYIFEISSKEDEVSTANLENSTIGNAQTYFNNGNLGYYGEFLNGGNAKYSLGSFEWNNDENQLDYTQQTQGVAQIDTSSIDFTTATEIIVKIQEINSIDNEEEDLLTNINADRIKVLADGVPASSTNILNATATVNADPKKIDLVFDVKSYEYTSNYMVSVSVSNNTGAINHENIILSVDSATAGVDTSDWILTAYPSSSITEISLNPHYDMSIGEAFNNMVGTVEDRILARWVFEDQSSDKEVTKLKAILRSRDGSQVFDTYEVSPDQIESAGGTIDTTKGYILKDGDPRNSLKVVKTGDTYTIDYAFQLWDSMVNVDDLVFVFSVNGNQTLETGDVFSADKEWITAILGYSINSNPTDYTNILGYDLSRNEGTDADPKYLFESVDYSDLASGITLDSIGKNGTTKIDVTFAPDPSVLSSPPDIADINGYFGIRPCGGGQFEYRQFTTYENPEADSPFEDWDDSGNTTFLDKTIDLSDKIHLRANIDYDKLKLAYPDTDQFELSFRMDKVQEFLPSATYVISGNSRLAGVDNINFDTVALDNADVTAELTILDDTEFDYDIDGTPSADVTTFEGDLNSIVGTQNAKLTPNVNTYIDSGAIIDYEVTGGSPTTTEINFDFLQNGEPANDIVLWFNKEIQFSGSTIGINLKEIGLSIRVADPSTEDWTVFDYTDISIDLALINAEIVTQFGTFGKYAIHLTALPDNTGGDTDIIMPYAYTEADTYQGQLLTWADIGMTHDYGDCVQFEAGGGIQQIQIADSTVNNLFSYSLAQPFTITMQYNNASSSSAGNMRMLNSNATQGLRFFLPASDGDFQCEFRNTNSNRKGFDFQHNFTDGDEYIWFTITYDGSQSENGFEFYTNGIKRDINRYSVGSLLPSDTTLAASYEIGQNAQDVNVFKVKRLALHDRVLTAEEVRKTCNDISFVPASGLLRNYNMGVISPTYPANPEYIYEETDDATNSPNAVLDNHSNNRVSF